MTPEIWADRPILITGAGGGIGRACAQQLHALGAPLILLDRHDSALQRVRETLDATAPIHTICSDMRSPQACREALEPVGQLHALIHMAGIYETDDLDAASRATWDRTLAVNLDMAFDLVTTLAPRLRSADGARIIMATSVAYRRGSWDHLAYSASKGGIAGLIRALSRRLAPDVLVNGIAPGIIATAMPAALIAERGEALMREIPLRRWGTADEVAGVATFLCSRAAGYITGQIINVDGGMVNS